MKKPFYSRYHLLILTLAAFLLPFVVLGAQRAMRTNTNDVRTWLPNDYEETRHYQWFKEKFGTEEFILVTWEGCILDNPKVPLLAHKLVPEKDDPGHDQRRAFFQSTISGPQLLDQLTAAPINLTRSTALARLQHKLVGPDGKQTCVIVTPTELGKTRLHESLAMIYQVAEDECNIPRDSIRMGGPPVINAAVDVEGARSLSRLAGLSGIVGVLIAFWCFRSIKLTALVFVTALYSGGAALAIVWYCGGTMNAILLTMPPLVYVAAMSGSIHLVNYYREALPEAGPQGAPGSAVKHARLPLCLATITTAVGLLSLCYSELLPIQQFGVYSAMGVVASSILLFFFLPGVLAMSPLRTTDLPDDHEEHHDDGLIRLSPGWRRFAQFVTGKQAWVTISCLAVMGLCAYGVQYMQTSIKIEKFFKKSAPIIQQYAWIETKLGALVPMELVVRIDKSSDLNTLERLELVDQVQKSVEAIPHVGSSISSVTFAPKLQGSYARRSVINRNLEKNRDSFVKAGYLRETDTEDLWRISLRVGSGNDVDYGQFVTTIRSQVEPLLAKERESGTTGISAVYTGMVPVVYMAQRSLLDGLLFGFSTDVLLIVLAIMLAVRHWSAGLLITITSIFPSALVFGTMSWLGILVDIGTVMAPCVALGVTVDDVVHFLLWFRRGIERGMDRRQAVMLAYEGCAKPMYQSWAVIGLGLSVFALSPFVPTLRFGALMICLLSAGLIGNLFLMPALLAGPLGALFERRIRKVEARKKPSETVDTVPFEPVHKQLHAVETRTRPPRRSVQS